MHPAPEPDPGQHPSAHSEPGSSEGYLPEMTPSRMASATHSSASASLQTESTPTSASSLEEAAGDVCSSSSESHVRPPLVRPLFMGSHPPPMRRATSSSSMESDASSPPPAAARPPAQLVLEAPAAVFRTPAPGSAGPQTAPSIRPQTRPPGDPQGVPQDGSAAASSGGGTASGFQGVWGIPSDPASNFAESETDSEVGEPLREGEKQEEGDEEGGGDEDFLPDDPGLGPDQYAVYKVGRIGSFVVRVCVFGFEFLLLPGPLLAALQPIFEAGL